MEEAGSLLVVPQWIFAQTFIRVIGDVPFVDVDDNVDKIYLLPNGVRGVGNPEDKEYYNYIKSYSPYDNIEKYPHVLLTAGLNDPRVTYWEPMKFVSRLENFGLMMVTVFLYIWRGHAGASGGYESLKETAL